MVFLRQEETKDREVEIKSKATKSTAGSYCRNCKIHGHWYFLNYNLKNVDVGCRS